MSTPEDSQQEMMNALGRLTVAFSQLELHLSMSIWQMLKPLPQDRGQAVTAQGNASWLINVMCSLWRASVPEEETEIQQIRTALDDVRIRRNRIVHSTLFPNYRVRVYRKGDKVTWEQGVLDVNAINALVDDIYAACGKLADEVIFRSDDSASTANDRV